MVFLERKNNIADAQLLGKIYCIGAILIGCIVTSVRAEYMVCCIPK